VTHAGATGRPSRLLAAALPVALLTSGGVVLSSAPSEAGSSLQDWFQQPIRSILVSALPVELPVGLHSVPEDVGAELTPTRYSVQLPGAPVFIDVVPVRDEVVVRPRVALRGGAASSSRTGTTSMKTGAPGSWTE
jgi:hypothetical protein